MNTSVSLKCNFLKIKHFVSRSGWTTEELKDQEAEGEGTGLEKEGQRAN